MLRQDGVGGPDGLDRLWTPHRMAYIRGENKPSDASTGECPFCRAQREDDTDALVVHRGSEAFVVLNLYPYAPGHLMVLPHRHVADWTETTASEAAEIGELTRTAMHTLRAVSKAEGFNIGMNAGATAGAGIAAHLHQHVVPRWPGDQNFMPIIGRTKTLPELLGRHPRPPRRGVGGARPDVSADDGPAADPADLADDAALAASLVRDAGELAARMRGGDLEVGTKTSASDLVTAADRAAERLVLDRLAAERPDDGVLGEEGASRPSRSGRTWVVDPVDGTWNFVAGLDWWCSALALVEGDPEADDPGLRLGAVHHPAAGATYVGGPDLPGTRDGRRLPPLADAPLDRAGVATYLHPTFHGTDVGAAWSRVVAGVATVRMLGSGSMDATAVMRGALGAGFQHSVPPWDRLPGAALVRSVGGATTRVAAAGRTWVVHGAPGCVAEVSARLAPDGAS